MTTPLTSEELHEAGKGRELYGVTESFWRRVVATADRLAEEQASAKLLAEDLAKARAETERVLAIGKDFEADARKHFEQSCANLARAELAERLNATPTEAENQYGRNNVKTVDIRWASKR